jgi:Flp pilus assembly protein TadD
MQRHNYLAVPTADARRFGLSFIAVAVSLALTGCASHNGTGTNGSIGTDTLNVADAAIAGGNPSMALSVSQSVLATDPNNVDALVHEGEAYYALSRCPASEAAYQLALKANPRSSAAQTGLGRCLLKTDPASAEAAFLAATQDDPGNAAAFSDLGIARDLQGNYAGAASAYQQSLLANPGSTATAVNLGLSLALSGQGNEALQYLGPLAVGPDATPKIREDYAAALIASGRDADARQVLAVDLPPDQVDSAMTGFQSVIAQGITNPAPPAAPPPTQPQIQTAPVTAIPMQSSYAPVPLVPPASPAPIPAPVVATAPPPPVPAPPPAPIPAPYVAVAAPVPVPVVKPVPKPVPQVAAAAPAPVQAPKPVEQEKTVSTQNTVTPTATVEPAAPPKLATPAPAVVAAAAPAPAPVSKPAPAVPSPEKIAAIVPAAKPVPTPAPEAVPESAPTPPPEQASIPATGPATGSDAAVQIAALNSEGAAHAEWRKVSAASPGLFAGKSPDISKVEVGGQTYYRLRVSGFASHEDAAQFCTQITAAHGTCMPANF